MPVGQCLWEENVSRDDNPDGYSYEVAELNKTRRTAGV